MTKLPGAKGYVISWGWRGGSFPVVWANITPLTFSKQTMAVQNAHVQHVHIGKFNKSHAHYLWVIVSQSTMVDSRRVIHNHGLRLRLMILPPHRPHSNHYNKKGGFTSTWNHLWLHWRLVPRHHGCFPGNTNVNGWIPVQIPWGWLFELILIWGE